MRVYLLRHGKTVPDPQYDEVLRQPNPGLDAVGLRQAELLGRRLQGRGIEAVYSSDLKRTAETARIVAGYVHADVVFRRELREIDMGEVHLRGWAAFPELHAEWLKHGADLPYPGGESGEDVRRRVWPLLDEIVLRHGSDAALVTHGGVIMVLLTACVGAGLQSRFRFAPPANCGISTLLHDPDGRIFRVEKVNDTAHLDQGPELLY
jgi:broad specificity phosphatase PhoE